jgi:hypothetical protein
LAVRSTKASDRSAQGTMTAANIKNVMWLSDCSNYKYLYKLLRLAVGSRTDAPV